MSENSLSEIIEKLNSFWINQGCATVQPYFTEVGAGTLHPATALFALGSKEYNFAYVQPSIRPKDSRYGENPNRLQHYFQYQVLLKPSPADVQDLCLRSFKEIGLDPAKHDFRFVEDDWENPTIGAWGLGWELWCDGMEVLQFTFMQQIGGINCHPVPAELTYGLERTAMFIQNKNHFKDIIYDKQGKLNYGNIYTSFEQQFSAYNLEVADVNTLRNLFESYESECEKCLLAGIALPAYHNCLKACHIFNLLEARGALSVTERTVFMGKVRSMAKNSVSKWMEQNHDN